MQKKPYLWFAVAVLAALPIVLGGALRKSAKDYRTVTVHEGGQTWVWRLSHGDEPTVLGVTRYTTSSATGTLETASFHLAEPGGR